MEILPQMIKYSSNRHSYYNDNTYWFYFSSLLANVIIKTNIKYMNSKIQLLKYTSDTNIWF